MWRRVYFLGPATPLPQGAESQRSPFFGFPSIYAHTPSQASTPRRRCQSAPQFSGSFIFMHTPFDAELPNFTWQQICRRGLFLDGQPRLRHQMYEGLSAPQFWEFISIYAYTLCHRTTNLTW